jgi:hypothetical protein
MLIAETTTGRIYMSNNWYRCVKQQRAKKALTQAKDTNWRAHSEDALAKAYRLFKQAHPDEHKTYAAKKRKLRTTLG